MSDLSKVILGTGNYYDVKSGNTVSVTGDGGNTWGYFGPAYKKLAPKWEFFNEWKNGSHKGDNDYYIQHFKDEVLAPLKPEDVIRELSELAGVEPHKIILLCYEKPGDFCHRHLVADWLEEYRDISRDSELGYVMEFNTEPVELPNLGIFY